MEYCYNVFNSCSQSLWLTSFRTIAGAEEHIHCIPLVSDAIDVRHSFYPFARLLSMPVRSEL